MTSLLISVNLISYITNDYYYTNVLLFSEKTSKNMLNFRHNCEKKPKTLLKTFPILSIVNLTALATTLAKMLARRTIFYYKSTHHVYPKLSTNHVITISPCLVLIDIKAK